MSLGDFPSDSPKVTKSLNIENTIKDIRYTFDDSPKSALEFAIDVIEHLGVCNLELSKMLQAERRRYQMLESSVSTLRFVKPEVDYSYSSVPYEMPESWVDGD